MNKNLNLNFSNGLWFQGFRENKEFIKKHESTLTFMSNDNWWKDKYMNKVDNISSPTSLILGRYFANVLIELLVDYSKEDLDTITLFKSPDNLLDKYSQKIISILRTYTNINIKEVEKEESRRPFLTPNNMRIAIKRGLYDSFQSENEDLMYMYKYFESVFLKNETSLSDMISKFNTVNKSYEKWLLTKAIINKSIRENRANIALRFINNLYEYKRNNFDYWNSKSFYILVFDSKEKSINYLANKLNISNFLETPNINYAESLVMKNYATLLDITNPSKKSILNKCLLQTPQDVELWKQWNNLYESEKVKEGFALKLFTRGYIDGDVINDLKIKRGMDEVLVRVIFLLGRPNTEDLVLKLANKISNPTLKECVMNIVTNEEDIQQYTLGVVK